MPSNVKITVIKVTDPKENFPVSPIKQNKPLPPYQIHEKGQEYYVGPDINMPARAWGHIKSGVTLLSYGGSYPWNEEPNVSVECCTDGLRPVVYKMERIED
jgi:uncharacterized repeat protein (TIGR04076 family)